jgi:hypothetical protein
MTVFPAPVGVTSALKLGGRFSAPDLGFLRQI